MTKPVANGAECKCDKGSAPCTLISTNASTVLMEALLVTATVVDHVVGTNISDFGTCKIDGKPCEPVTPAPWVPGMMSILVFGPPLLTDASLLKCTKGGKIKVTGPGQSTLDVPGGGGDPLIDFFGDASWGSLKGKGGVEWKFTDGEFGPYVKGEASFGDLKGGFESPLGKTELSASAAKGSAKLSLTGVDLEGKLGAAEASHEVGAGPVKAKTAAEVYAAKAEAHFGKNGVEAGIAGPGASVSQEVGVGKVKASGEVGVELGVSVGVKRENGKIKIKAGPFSVGIGIGFG